MFSNRLFIYVIFIVLLFLGLAFAQEGVFDWESLGVSTGVIASIIAIVQFFKGYIPAKLVIFVPIVLSIAAFFLIAPSQDTSNVFYWAAAAAYLWKMGNQFSVFKSKVDK